MESAPKESAGAPQQKRPRVEPPVASGASLAPTTVPQTRARLGEVGMPDSFRAMLGSYDDPDEARDLEDLVAQRQGGPGEDAYADFTQLPPARQEALLASVRTLAARAAGTTSSVELERFRVKASRLRGFKDTARKSELTAAYRRLVSTGELSATPQMNDLLVRKRGRSHSGVLVITTFFGPGEFSCPKDCHYCPNQPGIARSYLLQEPAVLRGFRNAWDPIRQFRDRASALDKNGHVVDKIELIILGGTFSFYPKQYAEDFIAASFYAANTYYDVRDETGGASILLAEAAEGHPNGVTAERGAPQAGAEDEAPAQATVRLRPMLSLAEEIAINETARCRIIGVTIETRPDYINPRELRRFRELGVTRVQLGIQHLDDNILTIINRDCPTVKTVRAIQLLLDAGFKVDAHWMPDLPGSSYEQDREMFETLFSPENESFQVDQWKVYPTATVPFTKISEWYAEGKYKPYAELEGGALMVKLLVYIMTHCPHRIRLNRIIRDIPTTYIKGGERRVNLRQVIEKEMRASGMRCHDIRERECKGSTIDREHTRLFVDEFRASEGTEFYMSVENEDRTQLYGHLRLRLRDDARSAERNIVPVLTGCALIREVHTYGKLVAVHRHDIEGATQHIGVGTQLMQAAEAIARERGFERVAVIAGVGARRYYAKLGYHLEDTYMVKSFVVQPISNTPGEGENTSSGAVITEEQVLADDDNDQEGVSTVEAFISGVKSFFGFGSSRK